MYTNKCKISHISPELCFHTISSNLSSSGPCLVHLKYMCEHACWTPVVQDIESMTLWHKSIKCTWCCQTASTFTLFLWFLLPHNIATLPCTQYILALHCFLAPSESPDWWCEVAATCNNLPVVLLWPHITTQYISTEHVTQGWKKAFNRNIYHKRLQSWKIDGCSVVLVLCPGC